MIAPHPFTPGELVRLDRAGRAMRLCVVCGKVGLGSGHRSYGAGAPAPATPAERAEEPQAPAPAPGGRVADWRVQMLRHVVELVVEHHVMLEPLTEIRLHELRRALRSELYGTAVLERAATQAPAVPGPPERAAPAPAGSARDRSLVRGIRSDRHRELVRRAIRAGWQADHTGSGHIRLTPPDGSRPLIVSMTADARGHGWSNLRAEARRLGLPVADL